MNVKTRPVRRRARLSRHCGDEFCLTLLHLLRRLQQQAATLGGGRVAPLREGGSGGLDAAPGVGQARSRCGGSRLFAERIGAGKSGLVFSIMPLAIGI